MSCGLAVFDEHNSPESYAAIHEAIEHFASDEWPGVSSGGRRDPRSKFFAQPAPASLSSTWSSGASSRFKTPTPRSTIWASGSGASSAPAGASCPERFDTYMFVIGTAGHIDHGKSTLVKALTGIDPDRLREEKERGLTINLGFAWLRLPSGREVSVVDVPGHERFIKNMLAGVGGIDLALLVIAADEGIMPQTEEHLSILELLRVRQAIVALTKRDLVEPEWLELVQADVEEQLARSTLRGSPIVAVSATTGEGLPELLATIDSSLDRITPKSSRGRPRLPIDRMFP